MPKLFFSTFRFSSLLPKLVGAISDLLVGQGHSALQWQASRAARAVSCGRYCRPLCLVRKRNPKLCGGFQATSPRTSTAATGTLAANLTPASLWSNLLFGSPHLFDANKKQRACVIFCEGPLRAGLPFASTFVTPVPEVRFRAAACQNRAGPRPKGIGSK